MFKLIPRDRPSVESREFFSIVDMLKNDRVREFEYKFSKFLGADFSVAFPSGRIAMWALYKSMGIENAEIITPAFGCIPVADSIAWSGNTPKFVDIDLQTYNIDATKIEENISERTKAIQAVHLFGLPADMDGILAAAKKHSIPVVEDAAMAYGAEYKGKKAGLLGEAAMFSFEKSVFYTAQLLTQSYITPLNYTLNVFQDNQLIFQSDLKSLVCRSTPT